MILVFPSVGDFGVSDIKKEKSIFIRSFNKDKFNRDVRRKVAAGWDVFQMTSSFRRTLFGGQTTYFCELRRGLLHG